jgi:hypothetical protein
VDPSGTDAVNVNEPDTGAGALEVDRDDVAILMPLRSSPETASVCGSAATQARREGVRVNPMLVLRRE